MYQTFKESYEEAKKSLLLGRDDKELKDLETIINYMDYLAAEYMRANKFLNQYDILIEMYADEFAQKNIRDGMTQFIKQLMREECKWLFDEYESYLEDTKEETEDNNE